MYQSPSRQTVAENGRFIAVLFHTSLLQQGSGFGFNFGFFRRNDDRCGYLVAFFEVEQLHALRGAAGVADRRRVDADDLAVLADDDDLRGVVDQLDADDFAVAGRGLDVDDAFAAAGLEPVFLNVSAFAEACFGDREDARDCAILLSA